MIRRINLQENFLKKLNKFVIVFLVVCVFTVSNLFSDESSDVNIVFEKNSRDSRAGLTYSFRFSNFSDFFNLYTVPYDFFMTAKNMNLRRDVKFKYYGLKLSPFKYFILKKKKPLSNLSSENSEVNKSTSTKKNGYYFGLTLSPLVEDIKENINFYILDYAMKTSNSDWDKFSREEKKYFFKDLEKIGFFNYPILENLKPDFKDEEKKKEHVINYNLENKNRSFGS